jgi:hypothetical protein
MHNFVDLDVADCTGIKLGGCSGLKVAIANGNRVRNPGCCQNMSISIGNEGFVIDCCSLALTSYKMVLGLQCLESLGAMLWGFTRRMLSFMRDSH